MKKITTALSLALTACVLTTTASARPHFGVAEDAGKYADDGGVAVFSALNDLGMSMNRMWVFWDATRPAEIVEQAFLDRALPQADARGIEIVFSVSPRRARGLTATRRAPEQFVAFLQLLARRYPQVKDFIVGNEPNQPRFWQPQFVKGKGVSGAAYERVLALAYDGLKAVDPAIRVIGVGLSPRGNDKPNANNNISTSPVRFIRDLGAAYRASGRQKPIMDAFGFHPYPRVDTDPLERGYAWPNAGITNLDRIKQAVWDAFNGTAQPTFAEAGRPVPAGDPPPLELTLDEVGWQVGIPRSSRPAYTGRENVRTTHEARQADIYSRIVDIVACDPSVGSLLFFHLIDEHDLDRFQSGLIRADWTRRPSYDSVKTRIDEVTSEDGVQCPGRIAAWRHTETVIGPTATFPTRVAPDAPRGFVASAREEANYSAGLVPVSGIVLLEGAERAAIDWLLTTRGLVLAGLPQASGKLRAHRKETIRVRADGLTPGRYVYAIRMTAAMNPKRSSLFVSKPFEVE